MMWHRGGVDQTQKAEANDVIHKEFMNLHPPGFNRKVMTDDDTSN